MRRRWRYVAGCSLLVALGVVAWIVLGPVPGIPKETSVTVLDRNGVVLYESLSARGTRSERVTADRLPMRVVQATVAAEDRGFHRHAGISLRGVARALWRNVRHRRFEGGSTITQQVAKMIVGAKQRNVRTKLREAVVALRLELRYSKNEIMAMYLNLAPYGPQTNGVARASREYFGCAPEELTIAQAAYVAALPRRPVRPDVARQRYVLRAMLEEQSITQRQHDEALTEELRFDKGERPVIAMHFVQRTLRATVNRQPSTIRTSLDAALQRDVLGIITARRSDLLKHGARSVAVAVLDNATGEWLAWEGSGDYFGESFGGAIDGVAALRQPGSTLKPFTYALAFEQGYSPASVLADVPSSFPTAEAGIVYSPRNYDGRFRGPLRARAALAGSENVPAVALLAKIGPPTLLRFLRNAGFRDLQKTADYYGLGLTLGDAEVTLEQLIRGYAIFARGGKSLEGRQVLKPRTAFWIGDILSDAGAREYIFGSGGSLDFPFTVAVKTGTSQAYRDNWTVGYTPEVTVGVWVGNFDRESLRGSSGVTGAAPIFQSVMLAAVKRYRGHHEDVPLAAVPNDVERAPVCALSGLRPSLNCPSSESEWTASEAEVQFCTWHRGDGEVTLPAEYRSSGAATDAVAERRKPATESVAAPLRITYPPDGAPYLIDPTLRSAYQTLRLKATKNVRWRVNEQPVKNEWPLKPGRHVITAVDASGKRDSVKIYVK